MSGKFEDDELDLINLFENVTLFGEFVLAKYLEKYRPRRINAFTTLSHEDIDNKLKELGNKFVSVIHEDQRMKVYCIYYKHDCHFVLPYLCLYCGTDPNNPFLNRDVRTFIYDNPYDCLRCCMYHSNNEEFSSPLIVYEEDFERVMKIKKQYISCYTEEEKFYLEQFAGRFKNLYEIETYIELITGNIFDSEEDIQTF